MSVRWWRPQSYYDEPGRGTLARDGGGVLLTQAIHTLDLFLSLTPPVAEVTAFAATSVVHAMETEDAVAAALRFDGGALGALTRRQRPIPAFRSESISPERGPRRCSRRASSTSGITTAATRRSARKPPVAAVPIRWPSRTTRIAGVLVEFLDALDAGRAPTNSGRAALRVHYLIDALLESSRRRVRWRCVADAGREPGARPARAARVIRP